MQASRPLESLMLKILVWMLEKVGSRLGVGPVMSLKLSSQPAHARAATISIVDRKKRFIDLLLASRGR